MYFNKDTQETTATQDATIRTIPRLWCFDCSIKNTKKQGRTRPKQQPIVTLTHKWEETCNVLALNKSPDGIAWTHFFKMAKQKELEAKLQAEGPSTGAGAGGGDAPANASTNAGGAAGAAAPDAEVTAAVRKVQLVHPEYGFKKVAAELRAVRATNAWLRHSCSLFFVCSPRLAGARLAACSVLFWRARPNGPLLSRANGTLIAGRACSWPPHWLAGCRTRWRLGGATCRPR